MKTARDLILALLIFIIASVDEWIRNTSWQKIAGRVALLIAVFFLLIKPVACQGIDLVRNDVPKAQIQNTGIDLYAMIGFTGYDYSTETHLHGPTFRLGFRYELGNTAFVHGSAGLHRMYAGEDSASFGSWEGGFGFYAAKGFSIALNFAYYTAGLRNRGGYGINLRPMLDLVKLSDRSKLAFGAGMEFFDSTIAFTGLVGVNYRLQ